MEKEENQIAFEKTNELQEMTLAKSISPIFIIKNIYKNFYFVYIFLFLFLLFYIYLKKETELPIEKDEEQLVKDFETFNENQRRSENQFEKDEKDSKKSNWWFSEFWSSRENNKYEIKEDYKIEEIYGKNKRGEELTNEERQSTKDIVSQNNPQVDRSDKPIDYDLRYTDLIRVLEDKQTDSVILQIESGETKELNLASDYSQKLLEIVKEQKKYQLENCENDGVTCFIKNTAYSFAQSTLRIVLYFVISFVSYYFFSQVGILSLLAAPVVYVIAGLVGFVAAPLLIENSIFENKTPVLLIDSE